MATSSRAARGEAADTLCEVLREYVVEHGCEVVVQVNEIPPDLWDDQSGRILSGHGKRELVAGGHVIEYWKLGG